MKPESDAAASFAVTRSSNTTISGQAGVSLSQAPSANVSLGLSRSAQLTVEYAVSTWTVSAHRIVSRGADKDPKPRHRKKHLKDRTEEKASNHSHRHHGQEKHLKDKAGSKPSNIFRRSHRQKEAQYQWFWAGTQAETQKLTPDLKHSVKRHVVVKRVIPLEEFPLGRVLVTRAKEVAEKDEQGRSDRRRPPNMEATNATQVAYLTMTGALVHHPSLEDILSFEFDIQIRIKRRYGRLHRAFLLTTNPVKAAFLEPAYKKAFCVRPKLGVTEDDIPRNDTPDIAAILDDVKNKTDSKWSELQGKSLVYMRGYEDFLIQVGRLETASYPREVVDEKLKGRSHAARRQTQSTFQQPRHVPRHVPHHVPHHAFQQPRHDIHHEFQQPNTVLHHEYQQPRHAQMKNQIFNRD